MLETLIAAAPFISAGAEMLGGATSAFGASKQLSARDAMHAQSQFNFAQYKKSLLEGPSLEMSGLKAAGINPLLRYGQHGTPMSTSAQGVSQPPSINKLEGLGEGISNSATSAMDAYSRVVDAKKKTKETEKLVEDINEVLARIDNIQADTSLSGAQRDETLERTQLHAANRYRTYVQNGLDNLQGSLTRQQISQMSNIMNNTQAQTLVALATEAKIQAETAIAQAGLSGAERLDAYNASFWAVWMTYVRETLNSVAPVIPFAPGASPRP